MTTIHPTGFNLCACGRNPGDGDFVYIFGNNKEDIDRKIQESGKQFSELYLFDASKIGVSCVVNGKRCKVAKVDPYSSSAAIKRGQIEGVGFVESPACKDGVYTPWLELWTENMSNPRGFVYQEERGIIWK